MLSVPMIWLFMIGFVVFNCVLICIILRVQALRRRRQNGGLAEPPHLRQEASPPAAPESPLPR